jgi:hypothetical protein
MSPRSIPEFPSAPNATDTALIFVPPLNTLKNRGPRRAFTDTSTRGRSMEWSMQQISEHRVRSTIGRALGIAAAALLCVIAVSQPNLARAEGHGGGGGFHGGGFGGFHGGGFRPAFRVSHEGGFHDGRFHDGRFFGGVGLGGYYPYDGGYYDYAQPSYSQTWYYCADPAGYYPEVTQCYTGWQAVSG